MADGAPDTVWMDVLPSMDKFGSRLTSGATKAATVAGKASGKAWAGGFDASATPQGQRAIIAELAKTAKQAEALAARETQAIAKARAGQREATAKVVEAEAKLRAARSTGDASKIEAAELRLAAARERQLGAGERVRQSEQALSAAQKSRRDTATQLSVAEAKLAKDADTATAAHTRFGRSLKSVDMGSVRNSMRNADWQGFATGATVATGSVVAGFGFAGKAAMDFDRDIRGVAAVSGATGTQLDAMSAKAVQLGKDTVFSASDAAMAMQELVKAGVPVESVLNGAADATVALAAASGVDMATAASLASNAMNSFNIKASGMAHVSDMIAGAANASAIDVGEFGMAMQQVSAVAHSAGFSFDETAVAIAEMGNAGIKGSDAGTSLKTMFNNLVPTTESATETMRSLGIITADGANRFYDAQGNVKSLAQVQDILRSATKGLSEEQRNAALRIMFGTDAMRAATVMSQQGATGYTKVATAMGKVTAEQVAQTRMGGLSGSWEQLKGSVETAAIVYGTKLLPAMTKVTNGLTTAANWMTRHGKTTAVLAISLGVLATGFGVAAAAVWVLNSALLANPLTWVIVGITALTAAVVALAMNWSTVVRVVKGAWAGVAGWFDTSVWQPIKSGFSWMGRQVSAGWDWAKSATSAAWGWISSKTSSGVSDTSMVVKSGWGSVSSLTVSAWGGISSTVSGAVGKVAGWVATGWDKVQLATRVAWIAVQQLIVSPLQRAWTWVVGFATGLARDFLAGATIVLGFLNGVWQRVYPILVLPFNLGRKLITLAWQGITSAATAAGTWMVGRFAAGWNRVSAVLSGPLNTARTLIVGHWVAITGAFTAGWNRVSGWAARSWAQVKTKVTGPLNTARTLIVGHWVAITDAFSAGWSRTAAWAKNSWALVETRVKEPLRKGKDAIGTLWGGISTTFTNAWNRTALWAKNNWSQTETKIKEPVRKGKDGVSNSWGSIKTAFANAWSATAAWAKNSWSQVEGRIKSPVQRAKDAIGTLWGGIKRAFSDGVTRVGQIWSGLQEAVKKPIRFVITTVLNNGLVSGFNKLARFAGSPEIKPIPLPKGFATGGFTGVGGRLQPAGIVHAGEYVMDQNTVRAAGGPGFFDSLRSAVRNGFAGGGFVWPSTSRTISGNHANHAGVDIAAPMGSPIFAVRAGRVETAGWVSGFGNAVYQALDNGMRAVYGHMSRILVKTGQTVTAGQKIGLIGSTGRSTGPHLHIEIAPGGDINNMSNRAATFALLNGAPIPAGSGGGLAGALSGIWDKISGFGGNLAGMLRGIGDSPVAQMVAKLPGKLVGGLKDKLTSFAQRAMDSAGSAIASGVGKLASGPSVLIGRKMAADRGWTGAEWDALHALWTGESGWNPYADNPTSSAYGIPQALPGSKMASAGWDWRFNPATQIRWGLGYIADRYGSPSSAYRTWLSRNPHWYDAGGWLPTGQTVTVNQTGRPEAVLTDTQWAAITRIAAHVTARPANPGGEGYHSQVNFNGPVGWDPDRVAREITNRQRDALAMEAMDYVA